MENKESELLTIEELAAFLKVSKSFIYERTRFGTSAFPHVKIGRHMRFEKDRVLEHLKKQSPDKI